MTDAAAAIKIRETFLVDVDLIDADPNNANQHSPEQLQLIAASIRTKGLNGPISVWKPKPRSKRWEICNGEGRWRACKEILQLPQIPAVDVSDLSEAERIEYQLGDNRIPQLATWNASVLAQQAAKLEGMQPGALAAAGFASADFAKIGAPLSQMPELSSDPRGEFQQITFIVHDNQLEAMRQAMDRAKATGVDESVNKNSNGNAIAQVCADYLRLTDDTPSE